MSINPAAPEVLAALVELGGTWKTLRTSADECFDLVTLTVGRVVICAYSELRDPPVSDADQGRVTAGIVTAPPPVTT